MSALNDSGRCGDKPGLTSNIHRPATSANCSAESLRLRMVDCNWRSEASTSWAGRSSNSESSSTDIDLPAPNRIASRMVGSSGSDNLRDLLNLRLRIESQRQCCKVVFVVPKVSESYLAVPAILLL